MYPRFYFSRIIPGQLIMSLNIALKGLQKKFVKNMSKQKKVIGNIRFQIIIIILFDIEFVALKNLIIAN